MNQRFFVVRRTRRTLSAKGSRTSSESSHRPWLLTGDTLVTWTFFIQTSCLGSISPPETGHLALAPHWGHSCHLDIFYSDFLSGQHKPSGVWSSGPGSSLRTTLVTGSSWRRPAWGEDRRRIREEEKRAPFEAFVNMTLIMARSSSSGGLGTRAAAWELFSKLKNNSGLGLGPRRARRAVSWSWRRPAWGEERRRSREEEKELDLKLSLTCLMTNDQ